MTTKGIDYFNRNHPLTNLQIQASLTIRRQMYEWLRQQMGGVAGKSFLEHGATPDTERADSNCFIRWLLADGACVYATSPEDISHLETHFPHLTVIDWQHDHEIPQKFAIDCVISSAVLEHVGNQASQQSYLQNLFIAYPRIFLTTPNRHHWLEFHTKLPVLHWLPRPWHRWLLARLGMKFWSQEENLRLLHHQEILSLIQNTATQAKVRIEQHWYYPKFLGMVSNHVVLIEKYRT
ncbi:hypothetical protein [Geitlerinema sp. PCC 9228]|uniref:hypothetical protein n=1 Tax=Geitlerinema sp. PCC 9228 TaxID=111611 RepID=UPI0008F9A39C|nr:hypothetical protein [Geitlerinema sp. PCC 9228]